MRRQRELKRTQTIILRVGALLGRRRGVGFSLKNKKRENRTRQEEKKRREEKHRRKEDRPRTKQEKKTRRHHDKTRQEQDKTRQNKTRQDKTRQTYAVEDRPRRIDQTFVLLDGALFGNRKEGVGGYLV